VIGSRLGTYEIVPPIGTGGTGELAPCYSTWWLDGRGSLYDHAGGQPHFAAGVVMSRQLPEARMKETALGPYRLIAAGLFGLGFFSVVYPAIVWLFAPRRVFAVHHVYFLCAGLALLLLAALCVWIGRSRVNRTGR